MVMDRSQEIADRYCAQVARRMDDDPAYFRAIIERAKANLDKIDGVGSASPAVTAPWHALLDQPDEFRATLTRADAYSAELRRNHPLAGALPEAERQNIVREVYRESRANEQS